MTHRWRGVTEDRDKKAHSDMEARSGQNCNNKIAAQVRISSH